MDCFWPLCQLKSMKFLFAWCTIGKSCHLILKAGWLPLLHEFKNKCKAHLCQQVSTTWMLITEHMQWFVKLNKQLRPIESFQMDPVRVLESQLNSKCMFWILPGGYVNHRRQYLYLSIGVLEEKICESLISLPSHYTSDYLNTVFVNIFRHVRQFLHLVWHSFICK